jgi:hypothetical protein
LCVKEFLSCAREIAEQDAGHIFGWRFPARNLKLKLNLASPFWVASEINVGSGIKRK